MEKSDFKKQDMTCNRSGFIYTYTHPGDSRVAQTVKNLSAMQETWVWFLEWEDPWEKEMATHFSILAWKIPWTEEPGRLQSIGSQRVGHNWVTMGVCVCVCVCTHTHISFTFNANSDPENCRTYIIHAYLICWYWSGWFLQLEFGKSRGLKKGFLFFFFATPHGMHNFP